MGGVEAHGLERRSQASIDRIKRLRLLPAHKGWPHPFPPECKSLTLDGTIAYANRLGERAFNNEPHEQD